MSTIQKKFRTAYGSKIRIQLGSFEPTRTKQAFKAECDINTIMKKYANGNILPDLIKANPQYGDFSDVGTYQEAMNVVIFANEQFAALPAAARKRFNNSPEEFLAFTNDPANGAELVKLGLATKREESPVKNDPPKPSKDAKSAKDQPKKDSGDEK